MDVPILAEVPTLMARTTITLMRGARRRCSTCGLRRVVYALRVGAEQGPWTCKVCSGL